MMIKQQVHSMSSDCKETFKTTLLICWLAVDWMATLGKLSLCFNCNYTPKDNNYIVAHKFIHRFQIAIDKDLCDSQIMCTELLDIIHLFPDHKIIVGGDFNCNINILIPKYKHLLEFLETIKVTSFNNILDSNLNFTYCHDSLQDYSYIDFICVSDCMKSDVVKFQVLDLPFNISDHCPVFVQLSVAANMPSIDEPREVSKYVTKQTRLRWDHAYFPSYYDCTRSLLQPIFD